MVVLIAAVVVLLVTSLSESDSNEPVDDTPPDPNIESNEGVNTLPGNDPDPDSDTPGGPTTPDDQVEPDPTQEPEPVINSITIYTQYGTSTTDFTISVGTTEPLTCVTNPEVDLEELNLTPQWSSSDENVFVVLPDGSVTGVGTGTATLTLTLGDLTTECVVRVNA